MKLYFPRQDFQSVGASPKRSLTQNSKRGSPRKQIKFTTWGKKLYLPCKSYEEVEKVEELLKNDAAYKSEFVRIA